MRTFATIFCAMVLCTSAHAQKQERSLIDRLLRPDMTLKNSAQGKTFATKSLTGGKRERLRNFYVPNRPHEKTLAVSKRFVTTQVDSKPYRGNTQPSVLGQKKILASSNAFGSVSNVEVRNAPDTGKRIDGREFQGQRTFLVQGKSQKSLDRKNSPLTVDQVRDLLNKNK